MNATTVHYVAITIGAIGALAGFLHTSLTGEAGIVAGAVAQLCATGLALVAPSILAGKAS